MPAREKIKSAAPMAQSGPALFSALKGYWHESFAWSRKQTCVSRTTHGPDFDHEKWPAALQSLIDPLTAIRRKILTNTFLVGWMRLWTWILAGLIVAGAFSPKLTWALILAGALVVIGAAGVAIVAWRARPSAYEAACRLDSVAGLHDRVSTAIHLGSIENPDGMILRQRQDAVVRAARVNPQSLFPIRMPDAGRRAIILGMAAASLLIYRIHYKPPMVALLQSTARSQLVQSILSPIVHAMEKDLQRTMALMNSKPDTQDDKVRPGQSDTAPDDLWKASDDQASKPEDGQQNSQEANAGDQMQDQPPSSMQSGQGEAKPGDSEQQQEGDQQSQQSSNGSQRMSGDAQQQSESQSSDNKQSLSQSLMQALKNMLSSSQNQASNQANQKQPNSPGMPQSGNSHQPGSAEADKKGDSRGSSDAPQKATQNNSSGAGSQQGSKELKKDQAAIPVNAVPDRVALESNGFKEKTRVRMDTGTGTAQLPVRDVSPQAVAVTNGAEQENIPARYRWYVQHYFEHPESGQK